MVIYWFLNFWGFKWGFMVNVKFCDRATKNVKNKIRFIFLCSFSFFLANKRKKTNQKKEKHAN